MHGPGGVDVARKFIPLLTRRSGTFELRSLEVMKSIRHPNLVSLFGAWHRDNWLILARLELCDRSLQDRLAEAGDENLPGIPLKEFTDLHERRGQRPGMRETPSRCSTAMSSRRICCCWTRP